MMYNKPVVGTIPQISINELNALGFLPSSNSVLTTTSCFLGGNRYWFSCPSCQRRSGFLVLANNKLQCRVCAQLIYRSQTYSKQQRAFYRAAHYAAMSDVAFSSLKRKRFAHKGLPTKRARRYLHYLALSEQLLYKLPA